MALAITGFLALAVFKLPYPVVVIAAGLVGLLAARNRSFQALPKAANRIKMKMVCGLNAPASRPWVRGWG